MFTKVQVDVLGAKDLVPKSSNRLSNPYCILGLANKESSGFDGETVRSKTIFLSLKPKWKNVTFTTESENSTIRVEVWHKEHNNPQDTFEGFANVPVDLKQKRAKDIWIPLRPRNTEDHVGGAVWVLVSILASSKIHPAVIQNKEQRMVRIFLSSTFRDMHQEREEIVRKVLVELDKYCYERGASLTYIDMRWGITDEMGKNMQTIVSCLREVDNSRPYFVGTIAERYGWHQEKDGSDAILTKTFEAAEEFSEFAWIKDYRDRSVTELEIRHGYLLNGCMPEGHVFFYFRDRAYLNQIPDAQLPDHVEKSQYAIERLKDLKEEIAEGHKKGTCGLAEYKDAEHLGKMLLEDLKKAVDKDYPLEHEAYGDLHVTRKEHENYGRLLCVSFVTRTDYTQALDSFLEPPHEEKDTKDGVETQQEKGKFMIILGSSGSGKSTLTANWWLSLAKSRQSHAVPSSKSPTPSQSTPTPSFSDEKPLFVHFVGASALASSFMLMMIRMFEEINSLLGPENEIPIPKEDGLVDAIPRYLEAVSTKGGIIIIFDAVNQLPDKYHNLHWIPRDLPPHVYIVVSMLPSEELDKALRNRVEKGGEVKRINVASLTSDEKRQLVECKLSLYGKKLSPENMERLISHDCSGNPLFLTTVIHELCIIGHYAAFQNQLNIFLSSDSMAALFQKVLERWETLCDPETVQSVLLLLLGSRYGVTEKAILIITQVSPALLSPLMSAMKRMLIVYMGNLNFSHPYLRQAVELKYP